MSIFSFISTYEEAWKAVILPGRQEYSMFDLGPSDFVVKGKRVQRTDFRLLNKRGHIIECSFYQHLENEDPIPCVVYLHANGCCRLEAVQYVDLVLSNNMSLFCFDFSGSGKSDGLYSSVGWFEQEDLECIIQYLYQTGRVSKVAVWGRSMGAITTILYANKDPRIHCLILDSPFTSFKQLVKEIAKTKASIPGFLSTGAFSMIRNTIMKKANFDIDNLRPIKYVDKIKIPALFGAAKDDSFVSPQHTKDLYNAYGGSKQMVIFDGDHNSERPFNWLLQVKEFLQVYLLSDNNDTKSIKSFKTYFEPGEKIKSTPGKTQEAQEVPKEKTNPNSLKKLPLSPPSQLQKPTPFTWLEHSASTPNLLTANEVFKDEKTSNQTLKETIRGGNQTTKAVNSKHKPTESRFSDFHLLGKLNNSSSQAHLIVQKTYTIEPLQKNDKFVKTKETTKTHVHLQYPKTSRPPLKEFTDHNNTHSLSHISEAHSNKSTQSTQNHAGSNTSLDMDVSETKRNHPETKHHNVPHHTSYHIDTKRLQAPVKDKVDHNSSHNRSYGLLNPKQPVSSMDAAQTKLPNPPLNIKYSSSTPASTNIITEPKSLHLGTTNLATTKPSSVHNSKEMDKLQGVVTTKNDLNISCSMKQNPLDKTQDHGKPPKENASPRLQKRAPVTFQISLNSNIPIINPHQTGPTFDINFLEAKAIVNPNYNENRRASDISCVLKKIVAPAPQIIGTDGRGLYYYNYNTGNKI